MEKLSYTHEGSIENINKKLNKIIIQIEMAILRRRTKEEICFSL